MHHKELPGPLPVYVGSPHPIVLPAHPAMPDWREAKAASPAVEPSECGSYTLSKHIVLPAHPSHGLPGYG